MNRVFKTKPTMTALAFGIAGILSSGALQAGPNLLTNGDFEECTLATLFPSPTPFPAFQQASGPYDTWIDLAYYCRAGNETDIGGNYSVLPGGNTTKFARQESTGSTNELFQAVRIGEGDACVPQGSTVRLKYRYVNQGPNTVSLGHSVRVYGFKTGGTWSQFAPWLLNNASELKSLTNNILGPDWSVTQTLDDIAVPDDVVALGVGLRFGYQGGASVSNVHGADDVVLELQSFPATVDIDPDTLNKRSRGNPVTAYLAVPDCLSVEDIDPATVQLTKINDATITPLSVYQSDVQGYVLMVKFSRPELIAALGSITNQDVTLTVEGALTDGTKFSAKDTIRVIH